MRAFPREAAVPVNRSRDHGALSAYDLRPDGDAHSPRNARRRRGDDERESQRSTHATPLTTSNSMMQNEAYAYEQYYQNAAANSHQQQQQQQQHALDASKGSLDFIMNQRGRPGAEYSSATQPAPVALQTQHSQLQFLARAAETAQTRGYEQSASSISRSLSAAPPTASAHALASSASLPDMYNHHPDSHEPRRVLLLPPLDSRRRARSAQSSSFTEVVPDSSQPPHPAPPEPPKPTKKRPARGRKSTAKSLSYEEKRKSRACKVDGCENYIINRGLCFRHGGGKKCSEEGCTSSAKNAGKCWRHGA
ncbi:uncharacterized protein KRP23_14174, partial [Globisporangium polare]